MSETTDDQPNKDQARFIPGQPLPRLWKTEPDPEDEADETIEPPDKKKKKKGSKEIDVAAPAPRFPAKSKSTTSKPARPKKKKADDGSKGEKRVLVEETPALDTIESRQRARMAVGGLMIFCLLIFGWIVWGLLFPGTDELGADAGALPPEAMRTPPPPGLSRETEARYMLDRAREYAKRGQTEPALDKLRQIVSVYKGTLAAVEAQAALDRPRQNLPLFPAGPVVVASKTTQAGPPPGSNAPPTSAVPPRSPAAGSSAVGPGPAGAPPPRVAMVGPRASSPPAAPTSMPPPGGGQNPGTVRPAPQPGSGSGSGAPPSTSPPPPVPGPSPGPGGQVPAPAPAPAMNPNIASNSPPPAAAGVGVGGPPPSAPAPGPGAAAGLNTPPAPSPPPPGPGDAAVLIPGNTGGAPAMPPARETGNAGGAPDRGTATPGRTMRTLPPGFKARPEAGLHESGWPMVIVGERDGATMVLVPGGNFTMGSDRGDPPSRPAHSVRLSTYYIDQHEVTNRQFRTFLDDTHYRGQPPGKWLTDPRMRSLPDDAPAAFVSYQDAEEYAIWALKRLPTEAQWEMAARSVDGRRYPWGDEPVRWGRPRKPQQIDRVMSFPEDVSPYGVFDLAGNAVEWVRDWYDPAYYARLRETTTLDPAGPPTKRQGIQRVVRGNSKDWLMFARQGMDSDRRLAYVGFRCSLAVEGGEASALIAPRPVKPTTPAPGNPPAGQGNGSDVPF